MPRRVKLDWARFERFVDDETGNGARDKMGSRQCVYIQTDSKRNILRIGSTRNGLKKRYRGGTGRTIEAALHGSRNLMFVAYVRDGVDPEGVESVIISKEGKPLYNKSKPRPPSQELRLIHQGKVRPKFTGKY